jgi:putative ATP-binding cassette transporter
MLAEYRATIDRLIGFRKAIDDAKTRAAAPGISRMTHAAQHLGLRHVTVSLPDGERLVRDIDLTLRPGERWLITGRSGAGKSTLVRAIAGIWPFGHGTIEVPERARMLFMPQRSYLPVGPLRNAICYPSTTPFSDEALREVLGACGLPRLRERLDEAANWALLLSPGEQQRVAFARALLQQPSWLFLDEATSALDEASEAQLYRLLAERLPHATVVSVGHRSALAAFHDHQLALGPVAQASAREASPRTLQTPAIAEREAL